MTTKKSNKKIRVQMAKHIKDLKNMAKSAYDLCDPEEKTCGECKDMISCMNGMRNAIGDLADALGWTLKQLTILDDSVSMSVKSSKEFMKITGIEVESMTKKIKKNLKRKTKKDNDNGISNDAEAFYT